VTEAQQALLAQHETARAALATATDAVAAAQDACQVFLELDLGGETPDATTPDATETADAEGVAADEGTGTATPGTEELAACQDATSAVLAAQTEVDEAQTTLASLATDLDAAVSQALRALAAASGASGASGGSGTTTPGATTEPGTTTPAATGTTATTGTDQSATAQTATGAPTTGGTGSTGGAGGSTVASAADLLADQAAIDQAEADLAVAQSALGMVDLTTPIAGTVASVAIAAGDAVEASSTTAVITVLGEDGYTVSTTVSLSQVDLVEVGQSAQVRAGSTDEELTGTVTGIGLLNASTTSSDPSYSVDIALDPSDAALFDGSSAQVSIVVAASDATLTVPSSAVHLDGGTATVQVLRDGTVEEVEVERGAVGPERTEIADGLAEGDEVVLADLGQAMTTDDATSGTGLSGLGGSSDQAPDQVRGGMMVPGGQTGGGQMMAPPGS
jgi:HlyD family secretion protein